MKHYLFAISLGVLAFSGCQKSAQNSVERIVPTASQIENAKLGAVLIYADWCGSCKVLDPKVKEVKANHKFDHTFFMTLDYTDKNIEAFYEAARAAGIADPVRMYLGGKVATGQLLLIDMDNQSVVDVIKRDLSPDDIAAAIRQAESDA